MRPPPEGWTDAFAIAGQPLALATLALTQDRTRDSAWRKSRAEVAKGIRVTRDTLRSLRDNTAAYRLTVSQDATEIFECGLRELAERAGLDSHQIPDHDAADRQALDPETDR